jgi:hypothetical protein
MRKATTHSTDEESRDFFFFFFFLAVDGNKPWKTRVILDSWTLYLSIDV